MCKMDIERKERERREEERRAGEGGEGVDANGVQWHRAAGTSGGLMLLMATHVAANHPCDVHVCIRCRQCMHAASAWCTQSRRSLDTHATHACGAWAWPQVCLHLAERTMQELRFTHLHSCVIDY